MKTKLLKISVLIISVLIIIIAVFKLSGFNYKPLDENNNQEEKLIASWSSKEINDEEYIFNIEIYPTTVFVELLEPNGDSTNGFYPIKQLENCGYSSDIVHWDFTYGVNSDFYASIVPYDCEGVIVDGIFYESKNIELEYSETKFFLKVIFASVPSKKEHSISLIDKKGKKHQETYFTNIFD